ncbi:ribonuclease H-like domain-containing protein [Roridomyces roridus]|uniref:ribonuclease H n=1 Tax=Roridomyces roridus TaxID=1738132 RepID=A0AAD7B5P6_9AGAR|nr:ribonuclease H-like domain-containing protein [Roridomyces roridus]
MSSDVDADGWDVVYSDGACKGNGQVGSVAGVGVWWGPDDPRNIAERCPGDQTNNRAELIAILRVLETTPNSTRPLMIKTDSQYSIQCFNDWIGGWIKRNWITSSGQPVKNAPLIRYIQAHLEARKRRDQQVKLSYVKGHSGDRGNDGADYQANIGATMSITPERPWASLEAALRAREAEPILVDVANHQVSGQSPSKIRKTAMSEAIKASSSRAAAPAPVPFYLTPQNNVVKYSSAPAPSADELEQYADCLLDDDDIMADLSD